MLKRAILVAALVSGCTASGLPAPSPAQQNAALQSKIIGDELKTRYVDDIRQRALKAGMSTSGAACVADTVNQSVTSDDILQMMESMEKSGDSTPKLKTIIAGALTACQGR